MIYYEMQAWDTNIEGTMLTGNFELLDRLNRAELLNRISLTKTIFSSVDYHCSYTVLLTK